MATITKFDAAIRNLQEAIRLFFECRDAIAIHTLASAAQGVLRDIAMVQGAEHKSILHDHPDIAPEIRKRWINAVNTPRNFFKHADKDPAGQLEFDEAENTLLLLDATLLLYQVNSDAVHEANVFIGWYTTANPEIREVFSNNVIGDYCHRNKIEPTDMKTFRELLDSKLLIEPI